jgi:histone H3/H4
MSYIPTNSIYRIIKDNTEKRVSQEATEYLTEILEHYSKEVSKTAQEFTVASERKTILKIDIIHALKLTKIQVDEK